MVTVSRWFRVRDASELVSVVFSGLSPLVIENVVDEGERVVVWARTPQGTAVCPGCGARTQRVHGYHDRVIADVPVDARRVVIRVRVRRLVCPTRGCRHTFREQVPGVFDRYQRRTCRLAAQIGAVAQELAGRAGARALSALAALVRSFAALLTPAPDNARLLSVWIAATREPSTYTTCMPSPAASTKTATRSTPPSPAPTTTAPPEGVNTKTKLLKRQMYGCAGFSLLQHRILLG